MNDKIKIGVDAMGGDNSPKKILEGIEISLESISEGRGLEKLEQLISISQSLAKESK